MEKLKKKINQAFKLSGYVIRSENSTFLAEQLLPFDSSEHDKWLTTVIEKIQNLKLESANIDRSTIETAIGEINRVGLQEHETVFSVIDAIGEIPRYNYNSVKKKFELDKRPRSMFAEIEMLPEYLCQRYHMLHQKTIRHELFSPSALQTSDVDNSKKFKLYNAENLLSLSEVKEAVIMGQLNEIEEDKWFIEDPTGYVELDLSAARFHSGFFCEGCFVLAEGSYDNKILKVDGLGFPPAEPATSSRAFFGTANSWGGRSEKLLKYSTALQQIEKENTEATMVFLSDVQLDNPEVLSKMKKLFQGYDACPPVCIVLMGPFASVLGNNYYNIVPLFKDLADAAKGCDRLKKETDLIIVPDIDDPAETVVYPRMAIPELLCEDLIKAWPRTKLASNPCRLQYCTQQIVIFRMDLMSRLARNTIHAPKTEEINSDYVRTLICQSHLAPFTRHKVPILWDFDSSLWLYPLPDLVVIGDSYESFHMTQHGCTVMSTGSFTGSKYTFKMYIPSLRTVEDSEIPDGDLEDQSIEPEVVEKNEEIYPENRIIPSTGITHNFAETLNSDTPIPIDEEPGFDDEDMHKFLDDEDDDDMPSTSAASRKLMETNPRTDIDPNKASGSGLSSRTREDIVDIEDMPSVSGLSLGEKRGIIDNTKERDVVETNAEVEPPTELEGDDKVALHTADVPENPNEEEEIIPDSESSLSSLGSDIEYDADRVDKLTDCELSDGE